MKHIKKKFSFERQLTETDLEYFNRVGIKVDKNNIAGKTKIPKNYQAIITTDEGTGITAFQYSLSGINYIIPEPDPVLIYFHNSQINLKLIAESKKEIFAAYNVDTVMTENIKNKFYAYYGLSSGFVIFLFTSVEAFINRKIPDNFEHKVISNKKTEIYNKEQIQRYLSFDTKIKQILPDIFKKMFHKTYPLKQQHIDNLKNFRDNIVHTKTHHEGHTSYDYIYKTALNFDYSSTILAVRDFLNFYQPNLIEECDCGKDF